MDLALATKPGLAVDDEAGLLTRDQRFFRR